MLARARGWRTVSSIRRFIWLVLILPWVSTAALAATGLDYLSAQQNADGSFGGTPTSLATPFQSTAESLRAYQTLSRQPPSPASAFAYLNGNTDVTTEMLARKVIVNAKAGSDTSALINLLITYANADGGYGDQVGESSSVLTTAYVLEALNAAGLGSTILAVPPRSYLLSRQQGNGGWADGDNTSSVYLTALCARALSPYRTTVANVSGVLTNAQNFLYSQRDALGSWGRDLDTAFVLTAVVPIANDFSLVSTSVSALQAAQLSNGSWSNDTFTTALAVQAMAAAQARQGGGGALSTASINGYVLSAGSTAPIAGATVTLSGQPSTSVQTNADGYFLIPNLSGGSYTVTATKTGYTGASVAINVQAGSAALAGNLVLAPASQTALVRGAVFDAANGAPLAGVLLSLTGGSSGSTITDAGGRFDLGAVSPGSYTLTIQKTGYSTITSNLTLAGGQTVIVNQELRQSGAFQDTTLGSLNGAVINAKTGTPLAGATIALSNGLSSTSAANGTFSISSVPRGNYTATVSAPGFTAQTYFFAFSPESLGAIGTLALYPSANTSAPSALTLLVTVVDGIARTPISGATITLPEASTTLSTGTNGQATFSGITLPFFTLSLSAPGYESLTYPIQAPAFGSAQITVALSPPGTGAATSTLQGKVTNAQTLGPIAGARVKVDGTTLSVLSGADGSYSLSGITLLDFSLSVSAVGYTPYSQPVHFAGTGAYTLNVVLQPIGLATFQIVSLTANQSSSAANSTTLFIADIANLTPAAASVTVTGQVLDSSGNVIATVAPYAPGTTTLMSQFGFTGNETKTLTIPWTTGQFAPGAYVLVLRVVETDTISTSRPLGQVLAESSTSLVLGSTAAIDGALQIYPPLMQAGMTTPVTFSAAIRNAGNTPLSSGAYVLTVADPSTGAVLYSTQAEAGVLSAGNFTTVGFGQWVPTQPGNLDVTVVSMNTSVSGKISDRLYVGNQASGNFTVDKNIVPEGTQTVHGKINVQGVDTAASVDPLLKLVSNAILRGGQFTQSVAVTWHTSNRCLGCHVQTQSLVGLASSLDKAPIDRDAARFLYNTISSVQWATGDLRLSDAPNTSTALGLWSLGASEAVANRQASFRTRYRAAQFLLTRATQRGNQTYLEPDPYPQLGWWGSNDVHTGLAVKGIADLLKSASRYDLASINNYAFGTGIAFNVGGRTEGMTAGPDGALYALKAAGSVLRVDTDAGTMTTVVTGLENNRIGLAIGADGTYYVAGPGSLVRVNANGSRQDLLRGGDFYFTSVLFGPDGLLYLSDYFNNRIIRVNPSSGQMEVYVSGGLLLNPYGLVFDAQGNLRVANSSGYNILKVAPDKTVTVAVDGLSFKPIWLDRSPDGVLYVTTSLPYTEGFLRIAADGIVERVFQVDSLRSVRIHKNQVWLANDSIGRLQPLESSAIDTSALANLSAAITNMTRYFLGTYQDNNPDNTIQAWRLIGLSEARSIVTDPSLLTQIDTAITFEAGLLRSRQHADGGWSRYPGNASDALITAMAGIALDYTNPTTNDPVVRNAIQFLLNSQQPDGSWSNVDSGLTTHLGATSFVMAYLPKALDRLGGIDVDLYLDMPSSIQLANPSATPSQTQPSTGGGTQFLWHLPRVSGVGQSVGFDLMLLNMQPNETRPAARTAYLTFANSFTNEQMRVDLAVPTVQVANAMALSLTTDKAGYVANEVIQVNARVANVSVNPVSGQVVLVIRAAGSDAVLATLPGQALTNLAAGAVLDLTSSWNTGATLAGSFQVYGQLLDAQGRVVSQAVAPFAIIAPATRVTTRVTTDRPVYRAWDSATVTARVTNSAVNAILAPSRAELTVLAPNGTTLYSGARNVGELQPGAITDVAFAVTLTDAASGAYSVQLALKDAFNRDLLSTASTSFQVNRTPTQGIVGQVSVSDATVFQGATDICTESAKNISATALTGVTLIHQLINVDAGTVVAQLTDVADLPAGGIVKSYLRSIDTRSLAPGGYACLIKAQIGTDVVTLAYAGFRVLQPPIKIAADMLLGSKGRLLVLLDTANRCEDESEEEVRDRHNYSRGLNSDDRCPNDADPYGPSSAPGLAAQRAFLEGLLTRTGWLYTITDTPEAFGKELRSGTYSAYALLSEQQKLDEATQKELREAVFRGEGLVVAGTHDSRNYKVHDALGLRLIGRVRNAFRAELSSNLLNLTGAITLLPGDRALRVKRSSAQSFATYQLNGPARDLDDRDDCHDQDKRYAAKTSNEERKDNDEDECEGQPQRYLDAVTLNYYGKGRAFFAGFDLLAQATRDGADSLAAKVFASGLALTAPIPKAELGGVLPIKLTLKNQGIATSANVTVTVPAGASVFNAGGGTTAVAVQAQTISWTVNLAVSEEKDLVFYVRMPSVEGAVTLTAVVTAGTNARVVAQTSLPLTVPPVSSLDALLSQARSLSSAATNYQRAAKSAAEDLDEAVKARTLDRAITNALRATDDLLGVTDPAVIALRVAIDEWLRYTLMLMN